MTDKQIEALAKKNLAKSISQSKKKYQEATIKATKTHKDKLDEADFLFRDMKKREF